MSEDYFEKLMFKSRIDDVSGFKSQVLQMIGSAGQYTFYSNEQRISNTDWHLRSDHPRPYINFSSPYIEKHNQQLARHFGYDRIEPTNIWYQQYGPGDYHPIHTHGGCSFSNIIYVELPNREVQTEFFFRGEKIVVEIEEGDILSFPGILHHGSPINGSQRKTVIVWNSNVINN